MFFLAFEQVREVGYKLLGRGNAGTPDLVSFVQAEVLETLDRCLVLPSALRDRRVYNVNMLEDFESNPLFCC